MPTRDYEVGNIPPQVLWTLVRGDSTAFKIYVTDETKTPLNINEWIIDLDIRRNSELVVSLFPEPRENDSAGEFTVYLDPEESELLKTNDIFDVQLTREETVWTVVQGKITVIEDVTAPSSRTTDSEETQYQSSDFLITNNETGSYLIDGVSNDTITLVRGQSYTFEIDASGHPFWIQTVSGAYSSENIYSEGIAGNGTEVGTLTWDVSLSAPDTLYYACQFHSSMQGTINIIDGES